MLAELLTWGARGDRLARVKIFPLFSESLRLIFRNPMSNLLFVVDVLLFSSVKFPTAASGSFENNVASDLLIAPVGENSADFFVEALK